MRALQRNDVMAAMTRAQDVQLGQYVHGRHVAGRVVGIVRGVGYGSVRWTMDDGRTVAVAAATWVAVD